MKLLGHIQFKVSFSQKQKSAFLYITLNASGCFIQNHRIIKVGRDLDFERRKKKKSNIILIADIRFKFHLQSKNKGLEALFFH